MVGADVRYISEMLRRGLIFGPCLELGVGLEGANNRDLVTSSGVTYLGTDIVPGDFVDFVIDLQDPIDTIRNILGASAPLGSILALNVLEHTFDPINILDKLFALLRTGGTCVIITPAVWPLHDFPIDCWRILPTFYEEYARRRGHNIVSESLSFVGYGSVDQFAAEDGSRAFPPPSAKSSLHRQFSRAVHKGLNTFGRSMFFPSHIAVGCVIQRGVQTPASKES